jgi:hypothetical protein
MCNCNYCENFAGGHSIKFNLNEISDIKIVKRLKLTTNFGHFFEKQLFQMDFANEF